MFLRFSNNFSTYYDCESTTIARHVKKKGSFACGFSSSGRRPTVCARGKCTKLLFKGIILVVPCIFFSDGVQQQKQRRKIISINLH